MSYMFQQQLKVVDSYIAQQYSFQQKLKVIDNCLNLHNSFHLRRCYLSIHLNSLLPHHFLNVLRSSPLPH